MTAQHEITAGPAAGAADPFRAIKELGTAPLWRYFGDVLPTVPAPAAVPYLWRYAALRPYLLRFLDELPLEEAERRVLMLINPGMVEPPATTTTLYAGLQIIGPGETAQAHRHTSNAFRYVIEGMGAYTTVNGERVHMNPGDLLLTPNWHWHDHHHEGGRPMVWLDALDYPLTTNCLDANFFQLHHDRSQKSSVPDDFSSRQFIHGQLAPLGPMVVTAGELGDPGELELETRVNGAVRQRTSTGDLIFGVRELVAYTSSVMTLWPGDVILTGTPAGVGPVGDGDSIEVEIRGIGTLAVTVVGSHVRPYGGRPGRAEAPVGTRA